MSLSLLIIIKNYGRISVKSLYHFQKQTGRLHEKDPFKVSSRIVG